MGCCVSGEAEENEKHSPVVPQSMNELLLQRWVSLQDTACRAQRFLNHDVITDVLDFCDADAFRRARCVSRLWMRAACTLYHLHSVDQMRSLFPLGCQQLEARQFWTDRHADPLTKWRAIYEPGHNMNGQLLVLPFRSDVQIDPDEVLRFPAIKKRIAPPHGIYTATVSFTKDEHRMIAVFGTAIGVHFRIWINDVCVMSRNRMKWTTRKRLVEKDGRLVVGSGEEAVDDSQASDDFVIHYTFRKGTTYKVRVETDGCQPTAAGWFVNFNTQPYTPSPDVMKSLRSILNRSGGGKTQIWSAYTYMASDRQQILVKLPTNLLSDGVILFLGAYHAVEWVFETAPKRGTLKAIVYSHTARHSPCALRSLDGSVVSERVFHLESWGSSHLDEQPFNGLGPVSRFAVTTNSNLADFTR